MRGVILGEQSIKKRQIGKQRRCKTIENQVFFVVFWSKGGGGGPSISG